jgi:hypothetical protein
MKQTRAPSRILERSIDDTIKPFVVAIVKQDGIARYRGNYHKIARLSTWAQDGC